MLDAEESLYFQRSLMQMKAAYPDILVEWDDPLRSARVIHQRLLKTGEQMAIIISAEGDIKTDIYAPVVLGNFRDGSLREILARLPEKRGELEQLVRELHAMPDLANFNQKKGF